MTKSVAAKNNMKALFILFVVTLASSQALEGAPIEARWYSYRDDAEAIKRIEEQIRSDRSLIVLLSDEGLFNVGVKDKEGMPVYLELEGITQFLHMVSDKALLHVNVSLVYNLTEERSRTIAEAAFAAGWRRVVFTRSQNSGIKVFADHRAPEAEAPKGER